VVWVDGWVGPSIEAHAGRRLPGSGILVSILAVVVVGFIASSVVGQKLLSLAQRFLLHLPFLSKVYLTIQALTDAFSPQNQRAFKGVALVEYPRPGVRRLAFILHETELVLPDGTKEPAVSLYIPTNHVYIGDTAIFPRRDITKVNMSVQQGVQYLISAGSTIPETLQVHDAPHDSPSAI